MAGFLMLLIVLAAAAGFAVNWRAAQTLRNGGARLHSMTAFHGAYSALLAALPAFIFMLVWLALRDGAIMALVMGGVPDSAYPAGDIGAISLLKQEIRSLASGSVFGAPAEHVIAAGVVEVDGLDDARGVRRRDPGLWPVARAPEHRAAVSRPAAG